MSDGFGGALAAPIWNEYMHDASSGYCGDWKAPEVPFEGKPFFGPFAVTGQPVTAPSTSTGSQTKTDTSTTPSGGTGLGSGTTTNQTNNPTLFAQPPQPGATNPTPPPAHNPPTGGGGGGDGGGTSGSPKH
jgi:hypothetical protein